MMSLLTVTCLATFTKQLIAVFFQGSQLESILMNNKFAYSFFANIFNFPRNIKNVEITECKRTFIKDINKSDITCIPEFLINPLAPRKQLSIYMLPIRLLTSLEHNRFVKTIWAQTK